MALLIGGGFLISQKVETAQAASGFAPVYTDSFDGTTLDSSWSAPSVGSFTPNGSGKLNPTSMDQTTDSILFRPSSESQLYGKAEANLTAINGKSYDLVASYSSGNSFYNAYFFPVGSTNYVTMTRAAANSTASLFSSQTSYYNGAFAGNYVGCDIRIELIVAQSGNDNEITFNVITTDDNVTIFSHTAVDKTRTVQPGQWGLTTLADGSLFDSYVLYGQSTHLGIDNGVVNIKYGETITYTIADNQNQTITMSDGGAGGSFSPSTVVLNSSNSYTATVTYTPVKSGNITVIGTTGDGAELESEVFVMPYSTTIGYIGDSITQGMCNPQTVAANAVMESTLQLGEGFDYVNAGIPSSTTVDWATDNFGGGTPILTNALSSFAAANVEVVHIMLGANDFSIGGSDGQSLPVDDYKANLQTIINRLKSNGVRLVIVSNPTPRSYGGVDQSALIAYGDALEDLVDDNHGLVVRGDTEAFDFFASNWNATYLCDSAHLTVDGYAKLGDYWANAIKDDLEYQISPNHAWDSGVSSFTLGETGTLTHTIDKYFGEFANVVKVDGVEIAAGNYTATEGSTVIELSNAYLNSLSAGAHTLTVAFNGGVTVSSQFTIVAKTTDPIIPGAPNTGVRH